jgi:microcystin-dependent protein
MSNPFLGEIKMFGGSFAPQGWALCNGQLLAIAQNDALFNLIGTTYGGDGQTTFALPNLQGRIPIHMGTGAGLSPRSLGENGGSEMETLTTNQLPLHTHQFIGTSSNATATSPANGLVASPSAIDLYRAGSAANQSLGPNALGLAGGSQPHENTQPFLCITFIIALEGIYPTPN